MANYAVIKNGKVVNVIVAESLEIASKITESPCVEIPIEAGAPGVGWDYTNGEFLDSGFNRIEVDYTPGPDPIV